MLITATATDAGDEPQQAVAACFARVDSRIAHRVGIVEAVQLRRRILARADYRPADGEQQDGATGVERVLHRIRNPAGFGAVLNACSREQPRQQAGDDRTDADEEALHRIARRALLRRQLIADECAERFHRNVERCIENPQQSRGDPQRRRIRHREQRERSEHCASQKIRPAATEPIPGAVRVVAHDGLHDQSGQRRGDPENRNLIDLCAERLEDATDVGVLEREAELDSQESEAHVPDLPERHLRLGGHAGSGVAAAWRGNGAR